VYLRAHSWFEPCQAITLPLITIAQLRRLPHSTSRSVTVSRGLRLFAAKASHGREEAQKTQEPGSNRPVPSSSV